jgi:hypothetical protein
MKANTPPIAVLARTIMIGCEWSRRPFNVPKKAIGRIMANNISSKHLQNDDDHNNQRPQHYNVTLSSDRLTNDGALERLTTIASSASSSLFGGPRRTGGSFSRADDPSSPTGTDRALEKPC